MSPLLIAYVVRSSISHYSFPEISCRVWSTAQECTPKSPFQIHMLVRYVNHWDRNGTNVISLQYVPFLLLLWNKCCESLLYVLASTATVCIWYGFLSLSSFSHHSIHSSQSIETESNVYFALTTMLRLILVSHQLYNIPCYFFCKRHISKLLISMISMSNY